MVKKTLIALIAVFLSVSIFLVCFEAVYAQQMLPGIRIDNVSYAGQNRNAVSVALHQKYDALAQTSVTLVSGETKHTASLSDAGVSFDIDGMINEAFAQSHPKIPGLGSVRMIEQYVNRANNIIPTVIVNQSELDHFYDTVVYPKFSHQPEDATLKIAADSTQIIPAKAGTWVVDNQLTDLLKQAAAAHLTMATVPVTTRQAEVQENDLVKAKDDASALMQRDITLVGGTKKIALNKDDLAGMIAIKAEGDGLHARIDTDKLKSYLTDKIAPKVAQRAADQVTDPNAGVVQDGRDGYKLKVDDSVTLVADALAKHESKQTIQLAVEVKNKSNITLDPQLGCDPGKVEGKYIEINLIGQRMCLYEGTTFINSFRVSTGKWSTPTPEGTFAMQNKIKVAYSRAYDLYMPNWSAITPDGSYGIHGLPYRGNWVEGEGHIGTPVSHGCIRLGKDNDLFVYDWAPVGTPVFIHK